MKVKKDDFLEQFGNAYEALYAGETTDPDYTLEMEAGFMRAGEAFMSRYPAVLKRLIEWRGDFFSSDREVAALGMVIASCTIS